MHNNTLVEKTKKILEERGEPACEAAIKEILNEKIKHGLLYNALQHFSLELRHNVHHPALISLAFDAVGGKENKRETATKIGAAMVLLTGAAHLHDDIIDSSKIRRSQYTAYGKFGKDLTIILGDILLFKGLNTLFETCKNLPKREGEIIISLVKNAFVEVSNAEVQEIHLKVKRDILPEKYLTILEKKAAVAALATQIGAMLGEGTKREITALARYGRIFGLLLAIREEFLDIWEIDELKNRAEKACLPLPILYALRNQNLKMEIKKILKKPKLTEKDAEKIIEYFESNSQKLSKKVQYLLAEGRNTLLTLRNQQLTNLLMQMLEIMAVDLY